MWLIGPVLDGICFGFDEIDAPYFNILRSEQNGRHFASKIFRSIQIIIVIWFEIHMTDVTPTTVLILVKPIYTP